ncbi:MAG: hypothetical protein V3W11_08605 [bacterium]
MDIPRSHKPRLSEVTLWLWLGFAAVFWLIAWRGITDVIMPVYQYVAFAVAAAVVHLTPYFADRALSPRLRVIENGFSLFRPNNDGVSVATDYLGRTIAKMDYFAAEARSSWPIYRLAAYGPSTRAPATPSPGWS